MTDQPTPAELGAILASMVPVTRTEHADGTVTHTWRPAPQPPPRFPGYDVLETEAQLQAYLRARAIRRLHDGR